MDLSPDVQRALRSLGIDRATVEVCAALTAAGVEHVLLKGPSTAQWLYADPAQRSYVDTDLLLPRRDLAAAVEALKGLGLAGPLSDASEHEQDGHSVVLRPTGDVGAEVDLHHGLPGVGVGDDALWTALSRHRSTQILLHQQTPILDVVGRSLVVVLHAARNGLTDGQSTEDLRLLVTREIDWPAVLDLADEVDARAAVARGLRLLPEGADVVRLLGLETTTSVEMELRDAQAPALAYGLERLAHTSGLTGKVQLVARELWPTDAFLHYWADREGLGGRTIRQLRADRLGYLLREAPPAVRAWSAARRRSR